MPDRNTAPLLESHRQDSALTTGVKDVALVPAEQAGNVELVQMFERLATDPNASVEKIERLMALYERGEAKRAEAAFSADMAAAQGEMEPVAANAWNPQTKSRYASYEALDQALRPTYTAHGFGLSFNTAPDAPADYVRVVCKVTHRAGHSEIYRLDLPTDGKGAKGGDVMTKTHATGSAITYGMRYLLKMIFNIAVGQGDDDGNGAGGENRPPTPPGLEAWWGVMEGIADNGIAELEEAWGKAKPEFKTYVVNHTKQAWADLKMKATAVTRRGRGGR